MDDCQLISDFFGRDVLLGDRALKTAIAERGEGALPLFIPEQNGNGVGSLQIEQRLAKLAERFHSASNSPGFDWAFSSLYAHEVAWPECDEFIDDLLGSENDDSEISAHMTYSLACRRDPRAERCFSILNSQHRHMRGTASLPQFRKYEFDS